VRGSAEVRRRQEGALERLKNSKFFEKNGRTEESWQKRKDKEIENLESKIGGRR
jgi:hypothetical protein